MAAKGFHSDFQFMSTALRANSFDVMQPADTGGGYAIYQIFFAALPDSIPYLIKGIVYQGRSGEDNDIGGINQVFGSQVAIPDFHTKSSTTYVVPVQIRDTDMV